MYPLLAAVIAIALVVWMWRFLDREVARREDPDRDDRPIPRSRPVAPRRAPRTRVVAPDDDPEFLRELGKQIGKNRDGEQQA